MTKKVISFGVLLRRRRKWLDLTQKELAKRTYCAVGTIRNIEWDERRPSKVLAEGLARVLKIPSKHKKDFINFARSTGDSPSSQLLGAFDDQASTEQEAIDPDTFTAVPPTTSDRAPQAQAVNPTNIPAETTPLIGREREIKDICTRLRQGARLLTLLGPGGVGKTHLALKIGIELREDFRDDVYVISLAPITDPDLVVSTIAQTLGLRWIRRQTQHKRLHDYLRDKQLLLILDNFEHVLSAAPDLVLLLERAPQLKLLVTSRASLRLHEKGEQRVEVQPLALPDSAQSTDVQAVESSPAVMLFIARARSVRSNFVLTNDNAGYVAQICQLLAGLPLAIELAAPWLSTLSARQLWDQLNKVGELTLLAGGSHTSVARQASLRSTIAWSENLLDEVERGLFQRLAVFEGGCTLEAVEAVCADPGQAISVLKGLAELVDKSLLERHPGVNGASRYTMLKMIREYALERLDASGRLDEVRRAYAHYYLTLAESAELDTKGPRQGIQLDLLEAEHNNVRVALDWAIAHQEVELALRLGNALWLYWEVRGYFSEGTAWLKKVLELANNHRVLPELRAKVLNAIGTLAYHQGDMVAARMHFNESQAIALEQADRRTLAWSYYGLGQVAQRDGAYDQAVVPYQTSLELFQALGDTRGTAWALINLAEVKQLQGLIVEAVELSDASSRLFQQAGDKQGLAVAANIQARRERNKGRYPEASERFEEVLKGLQELGDRLDTAWAMHDLAEVAQLRGDGQTAEKHSQESLQLFQLLGDRIGIGWSLYNRGHLILRRDHDIEESTICFQGSLQQFAGREGNIEGVDACLVGFAAVAAAQGRWRRAATLLGASERREAHPHKHKVPLQRRAYRRLRADLRIKLDKEHLSRALRAGRAMTTQQAIAYALGDND
jgi:predicted ATPase/transcriptional regulator with XRE-family HTH domain